MVGDGINDAPALALSTESQWNFRQRYSNRNRIALMNDKLSLLPFLVRLSKNASKNKIQHYWSYWS
jgi:Cd2+/Zn2+-exporting ATPase